MTPQQTALKRINAARVDWLINSDRQAKFNEEVLAALDEYAIALTNIQASQSTLEPHEVTMLFEPNRRVRDEGLPCGIEQRQQRRNQ